MISRRTASIAGCALALAAPAAAQAASDQTITALGTGQAKVKPADRHSNASIKKAVDEAYDRAVPRAIADAREDGQKLAAAANLVLGAILSVDENVSSIGFYYGPVNQGRFGPDTYCRTLRRVIHRRDRSGRLHVIRTTRRKVCSVPKFAVSTLAVTFEAAPPKS
jgi:curli biogenesis system outer membrane secretion channel CsgG